MKVFTLILAFSLVCVAVAFPQNLLVVENVNDVDEPFNDEVDLIDKDPTSKPFQFVPWRPLNNLPPQFQELGVTLPPPPPPPLLSVEPHNGMQIDLGEFRFFMNLFDTLRPAFPWLQSSTTAAPSG